MNLEYWYIFGKGDMTVFFGGPIWGRNSSPVLIWIFLGIFPKLKIEKFPNPKFWKKKAKHMINLGFFFFYIYNDIVYFFSTIDRTNSYSFI